jgi:hypothetical protein
MKVGVYSGRGKARKKSKSKKSQFQLNRFVATVYELLKGFFQELFLFERHYMIFKKKIRL